MIEPDPFGNLLGSAAAAQRLRGGLAQRLVASLEMLVGEATAALNVAPEGLERVVERCRSAPARVEPWVFFFHSQLRRAMEAGNADRVRALLQAAAGLEPQATIGEGLARLPASFMQCDWWTRLVAAADCEAGDTAWMQTAVGLSDEAYAFEVSGLRDGIDVLRRCAPRVYDELSVLVVQLALCQGGAFNGICDADWFGLLLLHPPRPHHDRLAYYLEHLVHGGAQLYWVGLTAQVELLSSGHDQTVESPWNRRPVALQQLLFELFWLARASMTFEAALANGGSAALGQKAKVLRGGYEQVRAASSELLKHRLTEYGRCVFDAAVDR